MVLGLSTHTFLITFKVLTFSDSSSVCRLSAIGMGWEKAFGQVDNMGNIDTNGKGWVDVDQKGQIVPVWEAFELF